MTVATEKGILSLMKTIFNLSETVYSDGKNIYAKGNFHNIAIFDINEILIGVGDENGWYIPKNIYEKFSEAVKLSKSLDALITGMSKFVKINKDKVENCIKPHTDTESLKYWDNINANVLPAFNILEKCGKISVGDYSLLINENDVVNILENYSKNFEEIRTTEALYSLTNSKSALQSIIISDIDELIERTTITIVNYYSTKEPITIAIDYTNFKS